MKKLPLLLAFMLITCFVANAGEIYVFHDSSCMDKLQFKEKTLSADYKLRTTGNLISYNIHANDNEIVRLDITTEGEELLSDMPIDTKNCNELIWDEQFAKDINAQVTDIFIVSLEGGKYRISPVVKASYFYSSDDEISYGNEKFGFSFDQGEFDTNADLLTYGLKSKVKFNFADDMHCPGEFHFYKSSKGRNLSENEMVVVPQIGVVRDYTISKKLNRNLRELSLVKVNDIPLTSFMENLCNNTDVKITEVTKSVAKETETVATERKTTKKEKVKNVDAPQLVKEAEKVVNTPVITTSLKCNHIYRMADSGFYYDRNTSLPAEGECGGITYVNGMMQNSDYQTTTETTSFVSNAPLEDEFVAKGGETIVVEQEVMLSEKTTVEAPKQEVIKTVVKEKIVYKEPKVIYKEASPIIIDESIEPQDTKIISRPQINTRSSNLDCAVAPRTGYHLVKKGETLYRLSNMYSVSIEELMSWNGLDGNNINVCQHLRVQPEISITQNVSKIPANEFVSKGGPVSNNTEASTERVQKTIVSEKAPVKRVYHYITQGDTFYAIAKKYDVNVDDLKTLNKLEGEYLKPGWRLLIPNSSDQIVSKKESEETPIIREIKPTTDFTPKGGSSMQIPESSEEKLSNYQNQHIYHTVGENEAINDIAMKYGTSINALKLLNEMGEGEVLIPYQKIKVR